MSTDRLASCLRGLSHPVRLRLALAFVTGSRTPTDLADEFTDVSLEVIAYHVRVLRLAELIVLEERVESNGSIFHRYRLSQRGCLVLQRLSPLLHDDG
jgi:DNA-binding transcriptional ArsR family regulator